MSEVCEHKVRISRKRCGYIGETERRDSGRVMREEVRV